MDIRAAEISAILKEQIKNFGTEAEVTEVGQVLSVGDGIVRAFVEGLRCFSLAESLGGTESLVDHPTTMTHLAMTPEARAEAGISDGLLRFSIGIEHVSDLVADLTAGLDRAAAATRS